MLARDLMRTYEFGGRRFQVADGDRVPAGAVEVKPDSKPVETKDKLPARNKRVGKK